MIIKQQIVPVEKRPTVIVNDKPVAFYPMNPEYITIHETGNTGRGANAQAHATLQSRGNSRTASWHIQVDDKEAIQSIPFSQSGWHAGDGVNGTGNRKSIGIEICVNSDGNYDKALLNAAQVVKQLMKQFNIPISKVVTHKKWSGKDCPTNLLKGKWDGFIKLCEAKQGDVNMTEQKLTVAQEAIRQEAIRLGITDGKNPFREVNQFYTWAVTIPLAKRIEELEKKLK